MRGATYNYGPRLNVNTKTPFSLIDFMVGTRLLIPDTKDICKIQLTNNRQTEGSPVAFLLDLEYYVEINENNKIDDVVEWINKGHEKLEWFFEGCITDKSRELFKEVKE